MDNPLLSGDISPDTITVFTDGSCYPNPGGPAGWAYVGMRNGKVREKSGHVESSTNNRAELLAIENALRDIKHGPTPIHIITDSKYCLQAITLWLPQWRRDRWVSATGEPVANKDLMLSIDSLWTWHRQVREVGIWWMRGHTKSSSVWEHYNAKADYLAGQARLGLTV